MLFGPVGKVHKLILCRRKHGSVSAGLRLRLLVYLGKGNTVSLRCLDCGEYVNVVDLACS